MEKVLFMLTRMNLGGTEKSLLNLLDTYSSDEKDVTVLLERKEGTLLDNLPDWVNIREVEDYNRINYEINTSPFKVTFNYLKCLRIIRAFNILFRHIWFRLTNDRTPYYKYVLKKCKEKDEYDTAIVYEGPYDPITAYVLFCVNAKKKIQWIHFDVSKYLFHKETCLKLYPRFDQINVVSEDARESLISKIPEIEEKTKTVYNVISERKCKELAENGQVFTDVFSGIKILTVGRLSEEKGQDIIPEIANELAKKRINFRWYIIGEGYLSSEIERKIKKYNVSNFVKLLGSQKNPYPYFKNADIYVLTSLFEAHCVTIEEAKIFNIPIVTTDCAGTHEQLDNYYSYSIVERNISSLSSAIEGAMRYKGND